MRKKKRPYSIELAFIPFWFILISLWKGQLLYVMFLSFLSRNMWDPSICFNGIYVQSQYSVFFARLKSEGWWSVMHNKMISCLQKKQVLNRAYLLLSKLFAILVSWKKKSSFCRMKAGWITILSWFAERNTQAAELYKVPAAAVQGTILIKYQEASMNQILPLVCFCCKWWEFWPQSNRPLKHMHNFMIVSNPTDFNDLLNWTLGAFH